MSKVKSPRQKMSSITDVFSSVKSMEDLKHEIRKYFCYDSSLWRAIRTYIHSTKDCVLLNTDLLDTDYSSSDIMCYRGTGPAISFKRIHSYAPVYSKTQERIESRHFCLDFKVTFWNEDRNCEEEDSFSLDIPIDLELNFTEKKFNSWIFSLKNTRDSNRFKDDINALHTILSSHSIRARSDMVSNVLKNFNRISKAKKGAINCSRK